jgi:hypothetical protein
MSFVAGASAAIMKTLGEIEAVLEGDKLSMAGPKRKMLRAKLRAVLTRSSLVWYRKGFNRGHKESFREFKQKSRVPKTLSIEVEREFIPNIQNTIKLKSVIK